MKSESESSVATLRERLLERGLDVVHPFTLERSLDQLFSFPRFGKEKRLGVLVGNSRALWPVFLHWYRARPEQREPLDAFVAESIGAALAQTPHEHQVFLAERTDYLHAGKATAVPIARLGEVAGVASLGPAHLAAHPEFGPWFAYRAVVALDLPPLEWTNRARSEPCRSCSAPCRAALEQVLAEAPGLDVPAHWQRWLRVRDACPVGSEARYPEAQIRYHYTRQRAWLAGG